MIDIICVNRQGYGKGMPMGMILLGFVEQLILESNGDVEFTMELEAVPSAVKFYESRGYNNTTLKAIENLWPMFKVIDNTFYIAKRFNEIKDKDRFIRENHLITEFVEFMNESAKEDEKITEEDDVDKALADTTQTVSGQWSGLGKEETLWVEYFFNFTNPKDMEKYIEEFSNDPKFVPDESDAETEIDFGDLI